MDSGWARRSAFSMYQTISFIVPSINFMAPSVDPIVFTWLGNIYPAHYSNCHVWYKYKKAKAVQRYGYNAIACCNLKTEVLKTLAPSLYSIFDMFNIMGTMTLMITLPYLHLLVPWNLTSHLLLIQLSFCHRVQ